ncbi:hypothetical protein [Bosea sp. 685]|uniref:hypothetical protein n=1 Tax=Bosea sp. 685 TaxID=3080057 RepID=UPI0028933B01|nr:hypothetical protein [Bosea sp. 685]WNJ88774.1 hypothetical protein RMR04_20470 [Bosea sp. 685]
MTAKLSLPIKLLLLASLLAAPGWKAWAEVPASGPAQLNAAFSAMDALTRQRRASGTLPRWSDPADAKVLAALWNAPAILGRPPYASNDIPLLLDILGKETQIMKTYALFSADPALQPDTARNAMLFQDEITRSHVFLIKVIAAAMPAVADFITRLKPDEMNDARRQGLRTMRLGLLEIVSSATLALRSPGLTPENQLVLANGLAENAVALAKGTTRGDRLALVATVQSALTALSPAAQAPLKDVVAALSVKSCEGLCGLE